jgi:DNA-binding SARP family transcriptional activator
METDRDRVRRGKAIRRRLAVRLLGGFEARFEGGGPLEVPTHKYRALLAYLALSAGRAHPRDKLVTLLWPDRSRAHGRTRLRQAILAIRRALGASAHEVLAVAADAITLRADAVTVDALDLQQSAGGPDVAALERAAELYGGELLAGLPVDSAPFEEWLGAERVRLAETATQALTRLIAVRRDAGAFEAAVQAGHRLVALDSLHEPAHAALIDLYHRLGRRSDALRQYQTCLDVLARELGAEPAPETRALYLKALRGTPVGQRDVEDNPPASWIATAGAGPFVGRVDERERLREALDAAIEGHGRVVVVTGEAGLGKSRLAADLAHVAVLRGVRTLVGHCHETDQILAFGPWAEALRQIRMAHIESIVDELGVGRRRELARLVPELAPGGAPSNGEPLPLFEAIAALLERLAASEPVGLVLEDLHWADEMSVRLLAFLVRRATRSRLLILATVRQEELDDTPFIRRALETLRGAPVCVAIDLAPLSRDETTMLVHALAPDSGPLGERVWQLSEGHPFTVVEMLRSRHETRDDAGDAVALPRRVREAVAFRLQRLGNGARRLVEVAAVIGRHFDVELLTTAADVEVDVAVDGLEEIVRQRLVESVGNAFRFVHHRILEAARPESLPRRALVHRRVAEAIEKRYASDLEPHLGALADHYQRAGLWEPAVTYLQRTGDIARRRGAYREAVVTYETALAAASHLARVRGTQEQEIDVRLGMRYALAPLGQMAKVIDCLGPAKAAAEALGDRWRLAWSEVFLSEAWRWRGDYAQAVDAVRRARALAIELGDRDLFVFTSAFLAYTYVAQGRHRDARPLFKESMASIRLDDPRRTMVSRPAVAAGVCGWFARSLVLGSERERAPALLDEAMQHAEAVASPHAMAVACALVGETRLLLGDPAGALTVLERGLALCRRAELQHRLAAMEAATGYARALTGRTIDGRRLLERAIARAEAQQQFWYQAQRLAWLADVQHRTGQRARAADSAGRALALARRIGERDSEALVRSLTSARAWKVPPIDRGPASSAPRTPRRRSASRVRRAGPFPR